MNLDDLERLAREATPGPWHWTWNGEGQPGRVGKVLPNDPVEEFGYDSHCVALTQVLGGFDVRANAAFIAAADPTTILRLVEIARAAQEFAGACDALDASLQNFAGDDDDAVQFRHDTAWAALRSALEGLKGSTP